jgi:hypothetical protein
MRPQGMAMLSTLIGNLSIETCALLRQRVPIAFVAKGFEEAAEICALLAEEHALELESLDGAQGASQRTPTHFG